MTFWPRFSNSRNDLGNQVKVKDISTLRPVPSTEFRGGSCCGSQISWGPHICKVLPGCIKTCSKTPMKHKEHVGFFQDTFSEKVPVHWEGPGPGSRPIWGHMALTIYGNLTRILHEFHIFSVKFRSVNFREFPLINGT